MGESTQDGADGAVADAAGRLYAVPLADFVASRKALAAEVRAAAGAPAAKAVLALRKPTLTAWAMNLVPRGDASALAELVGLGARMRAAQSRLDAALLTSVRGERDAALTAYVASVVTAAEGEGGALSVAARDEVRASAIAALADETAAQALASGQLTRALSYSGFGEVDLSGAVGVTSSGSIMSVLRGGGQGVVDGGDEGDEVAAGSAESQDDDGSDDDELTPEELARAVAEAKAAKAQAKALARERRRAEDELESAQAEMAQAQSALDAAEQEARTARRAVVDAQSRLDAARSAVAALPVQGS
ncbi:hypothetical protein GCM10022415_30650 [Knoellia locipacati]|uniref:Uncharacterized protein n=1 Tax=Knoellia locipacati TaxID=882824 RepID=A0A512T4B7_9MICO|nr:hypothetical protein [Knoellia locipacati]GEQ14931.1 hypothetical protein KLO01_29780 [Knoellia locipacati]